MRLSVPMKKALTELMEKGKSRKVVFGWVPEGSVTARKNTLNALYRKNLIDYDKGIISNSWRLSPEGMDTALRL